jgi:hypothetical protein
MIPRSTGEECQSTRSRGRVVEGRYHEGRELRGAPRKVPSLAFLYIHVLGIGELVRRPADGSWKAHGRVVNGLRSESVKKTLLMPPLAS